MAEVVAKEEKQRTKATSDFLKQRRKGLANSRANLEEKRRSRSVHTYSNEEKVAFTSHLNQLFKNDPEFTLIDPKTDDLFDRVADGVVLCKWLNIISPGIVKYTKKPKNSFEILENLNQVLSAVRQLGAKIVNIGAKDIVEKKVHIVLAFLWQTMREQLKRDVSIESHPEMAKYIEEKDGQSSQDFGLERTLLSWFNSLLSKANTYEGEFEPVTNFEVDLMDSRGYTAVLNQIAPDLCKLTPLDEEDLDKRAELMLNEAEKIDCRGYFTPEVISNGNGKLNVTFMTSLFNKHAELEREREEKRKNNPEPNPVQEKKTEPAPAPVVEHVTPKQSLPIYAIIAAIVLLLLAFFVS
eukprot:TRINITY_DN815_c0_g1_i2.p1 TRINITY_DN815_c0_g1~~TRINITY_DN815_c0_g1_i2.p1  ORF type:complete len:353 (-),score=102.86 TRINITY_DN815_c0_g1_i2:116-1174(-)